MGFFIRKIKENLLPTLIIIMILIILYISFSLLINEGVANSVFDLNYWVENLIPNIIADLIGIIFTTFIVASLFSYYNRQREKRMLYLIIGNDLENITIKMLRNLFYLIKRDEKYLSFKVDDNQLKKELKIIKNNLKANISFQHFHKSVSLYDVNESTYIYDDFTNFIPKIEKHFDAINAYFKEIELLRLEKEKLEFSLMLLEMNSREYVETSNSVKKLVDEISNKSNRFFRNYSKDESLLECSMAECINGLIKSYKNKANNFNKKYNYLLPLDVTLTIKNLESSFNTLYSVLQYRKDEVEFEKSLSIIFKEVDYLLHYFKDVRK